MTDELIDKESEQHIIGAILIAPDVMHQLGELGEEDFSSLEWRSLFVCANNLWSRGDTITSVSLLTEFERIASELERKTKGKKGDEPAALDRATITQLVANAVSATVTTHNVSLIAHRLRSLAVRRRALTTLRQITEDLKDTTKELTDVLDAARLSIDQLGWLPSSSRVVLFRDGIEIGGANPIYEFTVVRASDLTNMRVRISTHEIDKRGEVRRKIREGMHFNPKLPSADHFEDFVHNIVSLSKRTETPEALEEDSHMKYWVREWFKNATVAEEPDDLMNGYVDRGTLYYIQPQRLIKWLNDHAKDRKASVTELWAMLQRYGARRDVSVRMKKGSPRKLWGIPADFVNPKEEDEQLMMEEETPTKSTSPTPDDDIDLDSYAEE